ncbi:MAG TPA: hypothetical protein PKK26_19895, partial [Candidatus Wallbacteria bacterium]|nr:hypothetical protein [Candidatus Wallbacteria bacterium]
MIQQSQSNKLKKVMAVPQRYISYTWYEILAVILFFVAFVYIASIQFFAIEANVSYISCRSARSTLATAISEYKADCPQEVIGHVKKEVNIKKLLSSKYLRLYPKCWNGGSFRLNVKDEIYCTYHTPEL